MQESRTFLAETLLLRLQRAQLRASGLSLMVQRHSLLLEPRFIRPNLLRRRLLRDELDGWHLLLLQLQVRKPREQGVALILLLALLLAQSRQLTTPLAEPRPELLTPLGARGFIRMGGRIPPGQFLARVLQLGAGVLQRRFQLAHALSRRLEGTSPARFRHGARQTQLLDMVDQRLPLGGPAARVRLQAIELVLQMGQLAVGLAQPAQFRFLLREPLRGELLQRLQLAQQPLFFAHALLRVRRRRTPRIRDSPLPRGGAGVAEGAAALEPVRR